MTSSGSVHSRSETPTGLSALGVGWLLPPGLLLVTALCLLGGSLANWHPLWPEMEYSLSEAVYVRDQAAALALVRDGHGLEEKYLVRAGVAWPFDVVLTPLEAAVATRERFMVEFLLDQGVETSPESRRTLACLAKSVQAPDLAAWLLDGSEVSACEEVAVPWEPDQK